MGKCDELISHIFGKSRSKFFQKYQKNSQNFVICHLHIKRIIVLELVLILLSFFFGFREDLVDPLFLISDINRLIHNLFD